MNNNKQTVLSIILVLLFSLNSCRSSDTENSLSMVGASAVNFNLIGSEYSNSGGISGSASINNEKANVYNGQMQSHRVLLTPSNIITIRLSPIINTSKSFQASNSINSIAAIPGNSLNAGTMFRVIAYRQSTGAFQTYKDYTVGQNAIPMMLDNGVAYKIVIYSFGITALPPISAGEQSNIASAQVNYDNNNRDFMYQQIAFTPNGAVTNTLNITLRHKINQITTQISTNFSSIEAITGGVLTPHYSNGIFALSSGNMSGRSTLTSGAVLNFPSGGFPATIQTADPIFVNNDTSGGVTGGFSANVTIGGISKNVNIPNIFKITPEYQSNLTINIQRCGAYMGPSNTQWKEFMCHNLDADTTADPFTPNSSIHGAKYQWGAQTNQAGRYYSQSNDQSNSSTITGWINTPYLPDGTWTDASKTVNDPCPSGYRVPTQAQWQAVVSNNAFTAIGSWTNSATNYSSGVMLGNNLFLPSAGHRDAVTGILNERGLYGDYWSSTPGTFINSSNAQSLHIQSFAANVVLVYGRTSGFSIRCIAQ